VNDEKDPRTTRAERVADALIDDNAHAVESLEGVRLLVALAYLTGERDGSIETMTYVRAELSKLA
jgi:5'(3')-deoxyribonucleotidase